MNRIRNWYNKTTWRVGPVELDKLVWIVLAFVLFLACSAVGTMIARAQTVEKATAQAKVAQLAARIGDISKRQATLKAQYGDLLMERDNWRKIHRTATLKLQQIDKGLEGYVLETEKLTVEGATCAEEIKFLQQGLAYVQGGAATVVPLTEKDLMDMIAGGGLKATDEIEVK